MTLYARRRGELIHYRSIDDDGYVEEFAPTREPLGDEVIADMLGPDTDNYDYESEANEIIAGLAENPSDEEIAAAVEEYASHVTQLKREAVANLLREKMTSILRA